MPLTLLSIEHSPGAFGHCKSGELHIAQRSTEESKEEKGFLQVITGSFWGWDTREL